MTRASNDSQKIGSAGARRANRAVAVTVAGLICFQLARIFLTVPVSWFECPMVKQSREMASLPGHHHHQEPQITTVSLTPGSERDCAIRCCKGDIDGQTVIPLQVFGTTPILSLGQPLTASQPFVPERYRALERYLPPPFQPPRAIA